MNEDRARVRKVTLLESIQEPNKFPQITATIPERNDPRARERTLNHTGCEELAGASIKLKRKLTR